MKILGIILSGQIMLNKWESTNFSDFATYVAQYKHQQFNRDESSEDILMTRSVVQEIALELSDEISDVIKKIIERPTQHSKLYESRLKPYISNENLRTQVARTLLKYPELKKLDQQTIDINIAHIISRMFQIPLEEDLPKLNSIEIDPLLTYLTRAILFETLLDQNELDNYDAVNEVDCDPKDDQNTYGKPIKYNYCSGPYVSDEEVRWKGNPINDDFDKEKSEYQEEEALRYPENNDDVFIHPEAEVEESNNSIQEVKINAIANLGNLGFEFIQEKLRACVEEVYERENPEQRAELAKCLDLIKNYKKRVSRNLLDENLLLKILEKENCYSKSHFRQDQTEEGPILKLISDILNSPYFYSEESVIEPNLLAIIKEATENIYDIEKQEMAEVAESILFNNSYLPELAPH